MPSTDPKLNAALDQPTRHAAGPLTIGDWQLDFLDGGQFVMDGGVLFGVVPRRLWEMVRKPDAQNRLPCACRAVLARDGRHTALIDTGYGGKSSPLDRRFYGMPPGDPLAEALARLNVTTDAIDTVVLSHLHWDHAGGATRRDAAGALVPVFPRARHVIGRWEWEDAHRDAPELGGAYPPENFAPLEGAVGIELVDDGAEVLPGWHARVTGGHTRGHLALSVRSQGVTAILPGDLCPSTLHLRRLWSLAYDLYPLETRRAKPQLLGEAADNGWTVIWTHDPETAASRLTRDAKREFVISESWAAG